MMTTQEMKTCNAFFQLMRDGKVTAALGFEDAPSEVNGEPLFDVAVVFQFDDPEAPDGYHFNMRFDQDAVEQIRELLCDWQYKVDQQSRGK